MKLVKFATTLLCISILATSTFAWSITELEQLEADLILAENTQFIQQIEQLLKAAPSAPVDNVMTQEQRETQEIVNNVAGMVGNFIAIAQDPHNPTSVGTHLSGLIANFINIAIHAFKEERTRLHNASAQEILDTIDPLFIEKLKMAVLRKALQIHKVYKGASVA